jgi:hypothetical protein
MDKIEVFLKAGGGGWKTLFDRSNIPLIRIVADGLCDGVLWASVQANLTLNPPSPFTAAHTHREYKILLI